MVGWELTGEFAFLNSGTKSSSSRIASSFSSSSSFHGLKYGSGQRLTSPFHNLNPPWTRQTVCWIFYILYNAGRPLTPRLCSLDDTRPFFLSSISFLLYASTIFYRVREAQSRRVLLTLSILPHSPLCYITPKPSSVKVTRIYPPKVSNIPLGRYRYVYKWECIYILPIYCIHTPIPKICELLSKLFSFHQIDSFIYLFSYLFRFTCLLLCLARLRISTLFEKFS